MGRGPGIGSVTRAAPTATGWTFHATGRALTRRRLSNPRHDTSARGLGRSENALYRLRRPGLTAELLDFNVYCSPARLRVRENGTVRHLRLHHVDGLRQQARGRGLDDVPRLQAGAVEHPGGSFTTATVEATRSEVLIKELGWRLRRVPAPTCLAGRAPVGPRNVGRVRLGLTRAQLRRRAPPPRQAKSRSWRWCVNGGGGRVVAAFSNAGRVALVATTAPRHGNRGVHSGVSARAVRRAYPGRRAVGKGIVRAGRHSPRLFGIRRGRVRYVAVAPRRTIARPSALRAYLRRVGLMLARGG